MDQLSKSKRAEASGEATRSLYLALCSENWERDAAPAELLCYTTLMYGRSFDTALKTIKARLARDHKHCGDRLLCQLFGSSAHHLMIVLPRVERAP